MIVPFDTSLGINVNSVPCDMSLRSRSISSPAQITPDRGILRVCQEFRSSCLRADLPCDKSEAVCLSLAKGKTNHLGGQEGHSPVKQGACI